jgi:amino acid permease
MKKTWYILLGLAVMLGLYDIYTAYAHGGTSTISWVLYTQSQNYPVIPLVVGFVMGHIFAGMSGAGPVRVLTVKRPTT